MVIAVSVWGITSHKGNKTRIYYSGNHDNFRWYPFLFGTQMGRRWNANGTQMERKWKANGTQMERKRNATGTRMERKWNAFTKTWNVKWDADGTRMEHEWNTNGTQMECIYENVSNAFPVRLFLSSTVQKQQSKIWLFQHRNEAPFAYVFL